MSFHLTSENLHLEFRDRATYLCGKARREDGSEHNVEIRLDDFIGNDNGHFQWDSKNFTETAENIRFSIEGGGAVPVLRADLKEDGGNRRHADVNLSERIENENGNLIFQ